MSNENKVRLAHELLDEINARQDLTPEQTEVLRSFLPELPAQMSLEALRHDVHDVWAGVNGNEWPDDMYCDLETWLAELHAQLKGLKDTPTSVPALPAGMRLATHPEYGLCVVSPTTDEDGERRIFYLSAGTDAGADCRWVPVVHLTFIGSEPARPEFLETEADYENAPEGTIVACDDSPSWHKRESLWTSVMTHGRQNAKYMSGIHRRILRWGWGE